MLSVELQPGERSHDEGDGHFYYVRGEGDNLKVRSISRKQTIFDESPVMALMAVIAFATLAGWPVAATGYYMMRWPMTWGGTWLAGLFFALLVFAVVHMRERRQQRADDMRIEQVRRKLVKQSKERQAATATEARKQQIAARQQELVEIDRRTFWVPLNVALADVARGGPGRFAMPAPFKENPASPGENKWRHELWANFKADCERRIAAAIAERENKRRELREPLENRLLDAYAEFAADAEIANPRISESEIIAQFVGSDVLERIAPDDNAWLLKESTRPEVQKLWRSFRVVPVEPRQLTRS